MLLLKSIFGTDIMEYAKDYNCTMQKNFDFCASIINKKNLRRRDLDIYCLYPCLFWEEFKSISTTTMEKLIEASIMYFDITSYYHEIADNPSNINIYELWQKLFQCQVSTKGLGELFDRDDSFWDYFYKYNKEYLDALKLQERHKGIITEYSFEEFKEIAAGKSAIAKSAVAALGCLSNSYEKIKDLEKSQDFYAYAYQLYDDLKDWKEDYNNKNYTWFLTQVIQNNGLDQAAEINMISRGIFKDGFDVFVLDKIDELIQLAMIYAGESSAWIKVNRALQNKVSKLKDDIETIKLKHGITNETSNSFDSRTYNSANECETNSYIYKSLDQLKAQQTKGFPELKHWLFAVLFSDEKDLNGREECLGGDIFQRAFILNLELEMLNTGIQIDRESIDKELEYLMNNKHVIFKIGWSYFPNLPEYCCDIDTVSEFIKLSTYLNNPSIHKEVEESIDFILKNCSYNNGAFDTFMLDKKSTSKESIRALKAAELFWGRGADIEVNANFLYSLSLYNYEKYKEIIEKGTRWILSKQDEDGKWDATWYSGNYYGAYMCSRLLKQLDVKNNSRKRLVNYLISSQNSNSSWGEGNGNVQDTALALVALIELTDKPYTEEINKILISGSSFIKSQIHPDLNIWKGIDFIKINMWRNIGKVHFVKYKSSILTSFICIYALARVQSILEKI